MWGVYLHCQTRTWEHAINIIKCCTRYIINLAARYRPLLKLQQNNNKLYYTIIILIYHIGMNNISTRVEVVA